MNKELMTKLFSTDKALLESFHIIAPNSAENCAARTFKDLEDNNVVTYLIEKNNEVIGYYGIEGSAFLTGFFLTPENRDRATIDLMWKKIESHFPGNFLTCLYTKNTRAIDFMTKKTPEMHKVGNDVVLFTVRR